MIRNRKYIPLCALAALTALAGCKSDAVEPAAGTAAEERPVAISLAGTVSPAQKATRADGSLVNLGELSLPETRQRTYYRANSEGVVQPQVREYHAGIFGCYTGQHSWADLVSKAEAGTLTDEEREAYSANLMYNVPARIEAPDANGVNALSYDTLRFWPNNRYGSPKQYEKATFWAYYPYGEQGDPNLYGVTLMPANVGTGMGMGSVKFTMHPDAALQNDFMISAPVEDCSRDEYPIDEQPQGNYQPRPVQFRFYHMLAQVRIYAFIRGTDKLAYLDDEYTADDVAAGVKYTDAWGVERPVVAGQKKIDEANSVRWKRTTFYDINQQKLRADIDYKLEFNNIRTTATFTPSYGAGGRASITSAEGPTLGSATVNHFIMNPYWFRFHNVGTDLAPDMQRYMINDNYMYGYFEDTPVYNKQDATATDGIDWSDDMWSGKYADDGAGRVTTTPLHYLDLTTSDWTRERELGVPDEEIANATGPYFNKHYNYAPGNILMVVPQALNDEQVPHIVLTARGKDTSGNAITAKVTFNMLNMSIRWESGFIYCYAFIDELHPGDDIVRGPESITTIFDTTKYTDQW